MTESIKNEIQAALPIVDKKTVEECRQAFNWDFDRSVTDPFNDTKNVSAFIFKKSMVDLYTQTHHQWSDEMNSYYFTVCSMQFVQQLHDLAGYVIYK